MPRDGLSPPRSQLRREVRKFGQEHCDPRRAYRLLGKEGILLTYRPYTKPSLEAVAHHESAHAVAHLLLGLPGQLQYIEADDQPPRGGHTEIDRPATSNPTAAQVHDCI